MSTADGKKISAETLFSTVTQSVAVWQSAKVRLAYNGANYGAALSYLFQNIQDRVCAGGADSGITKRSVFSGNSESFGFSVRYSSTGGPVYFGPLSNAATPDAGIFGAGGNLLGKFVDGGALVLPYGQITFPATQAPSADANTLDDYEEGTCLLSNGGTATYSTRLGTYTKKGREVTLQFVHVITSIGTGDTGTLSGAPFTAFGTADQAGCIAYWANVALASYYMACVIVASTTNIRLTGTSAAGVTVSGSPYGVMANSTALYGAVTYFV